ncbi:MAG: protein-methionine-sulfoxide reductase heme-binding subunit MsrQ [Gemmatimonadales bacterium]|nr:protein-methionine-sulfoxide reductase heme-binding subunit MsrQ [Gemmatimonadales bacterium]
MAAGRGLLAARAAIWGLALFLLGWATWLLFTSTSTEPVKEFQAATGLLALRFLFFSLAITPLRRLAGWHDAIKVRRLLGLWGFVFACVHLLAYLVFDHSLDPAAIATDIAKHPWVLVGTAAWLLLLPLAITSTRGWIRRLGRRWQQLHRLAYVAAACGVVHFLWLVKKDVTEPVTYGAILAVLLLLRLRPAAPRARAAGAA